MLKISSIVGISEKRVEGICATLKGLFLLRGKFTQRLTWLSLLLSQIWVGCRGAAGATPGCDGRRRVELLVMDPESHAVAKELQAHTDSIQALCSAEDRYVLSGSARRDGKIAIWKVE